MSASETPIAIVGMSCLFPQAPDLSSYWRNIVAARVSTGPVPDDHSWTPDEHWDADPKAPDKTYSRAGGFLEKVPFDPLQHGLTPSALDATDTTQLLSLIVAREALKDAGIDPDATNWPRHRTSCILGVTGTQELAITLGARLQGPAWKKAMLRCGIDATVADDVVADIGKHFPEWQEQSFPGLLGNVVSGRIANRLDLGGTNCVTDAACASSLAAVRMALDDLAQGRCDLALSGGADTLNDIFMYMCFSKTPALSKAGQARPFDADADGTLISEGIAILALKREADARRDGDRIYAVIKGLGASSDGKAKSIYAPNSSGQVSAVRRAHEAAGVTAESVELIEAHGTGTKAGDAAEVAGLVEIFGHQGPDGPSVALGSVKSQIGHTKSTAGAAGLMKTALALYQKVLPPTAGVSTPNPKMNLDSTALYVNTLARPWVRSDDHPRRAGVSAFGFGGTNFHAVLEEAHEGGPLSAAESELFLFGATDAPGLVAAADAVVSGPTLAHTARAVHDRWAPSPWVAGFLATSDEDLRTRLATLKALAAAGGGAKDGVVVAQPTEEQRKIAVLFPGQGSQHVDMARTAALRYPPIRRAADVAESALRRAGRGSLAARIWPPPASSDTAKSLQEQRLTATEWAQPALGAVSKGFFDVLTAFGVRAHAFAGHSYGELVALHAAGAYDADALFTLSRVRGEAMAADTRDRGTMAAVSGPLAEIEAVLSGLSDGVVLANRNHPKQGVISGSRDGVAKAVEALGKAGLKATSIPVAAAFHSPLVADAAAPLAEALASIEVRAPEGVVYANATGRPYPADAADVRRLLVAQITSAVRFVDLVEDLVASGVRTFVECGPKRVLSGLVRQTVGKKGDVAVLAVDDKGDGDVAIKQLLLDLAVRGAPIDLTPFRTAPLPVPPRVAGSKATVWVGGPNHRRPETKAPPAPPRRAPIVPPPAPIAPPPAPIAASATSNLSTPIPTTPPVSSPSPATPPRPASHEARMSERTPTPPPALSGSALSGSALAELLAATRETLSAFTTAQAETARVHAQFLEAQQSAHRSFERVFETHARLVELAAGSGAALPAAPRATLTSALTSAPAIPAGAPAPAAALASSFLGARSAAPTDVRTDDGRVAAPRSSRPQIADDVDVPRIVTAGSLDGDLVAAAPAAVSTPAPAARAPVASATIDVHAAMKAAVADKTGYPVDMLEGRMDLEADLGIDSIKRVEILASVQEKVPGLPELDNEKMAALRTLDDVSGYLASLLPTAGGPSAPAPVVGPGVDVHAAMKAAVAEKTGYPVDMLEGRMDLEADLGIDSIKRVEILASVQEKVPGLPELDNEKMAALRTLDDVSGYLASLLPAAVAAPASAPAPMVGPGVDVHAAMKAAVAEKTGYPVDMLEGRMDLEADLGIDSIKRVEILASVQEKVPGLPELDSEKMAALRTLDDVSGYLASLLGAPEPTPPTPPAPKGPAAKTSAPTSSPASSVRRRVVALVPAPAGAPLNLGTAAVLGGGPLADAVADALVARGLTLVDGSGAAPADLVVALHAVGRLAGALNDAVRSAFTLARSLGAHRPKRLAFVTDQDGACGFGTGTSRVALGAFGGLAKTLAQEWADTAPLLLDIAEGVGADAIAAELCLDRGVVELGLDGAVARTPSAVDAALPDKAGAAPIAAGDLVVVTGGARGVTAAVVREMARRYRASFLLLGRSAVEDEPGWARGVADDGLKKARIEAAKKAGEKIHPRVADADVGGVLASREVRRTLDDVAKAGSKVRYVAVDSRDGDAVGRAVRDAVSAWGPVRGIVHGAGVIADKRIEEKTDEHLDRVYGTKVDGLLALLGAVDRSKLTFAAMFGSVAGRFGNIGQSDYAMANEVLSRAALELARAGVRARAYAWGPWAGGMVDASLAKQLRARGMDLIDVDAGAAFFCDDLERGSDVEVVVGGPDGGALLAPAQAHTTVHHLDGQKRFLRDHRIDGRPVLPAMMVLEWMARAAREAFPELGFAGVRDFAVKKGVVVENGHTDLRLEWDELPTAPGAKRTLGFRLVGGPGPLGKPTVHYTGVVDLTQAAPKPSKFPGSNGLGADRYPYPVDEAYRRFLFHGPGLRGIQQIVGMSDHGIVAKIRTSAPAQLDVDGQTWETDPLALDSLLQLMVLWVREKRGAAALPCYMGNYRQFAPFTGEVTAHVEMHPTDTATGRFAATLVGADGSIVATLEQGEYAANPAMNASFQSAEA